MSNPLPGEQERKVLRELAKSDRSNMKNRVIAPDVVEFFKKKIAGLELDIKAIMISEKEESELQVLYIYI